MRNLVAIILGLLIGVQAKAQVGLSPFTAPDALQSFRLNPARTSFDKKVYIGLGHLNADIYNSSGDVRNAVEREDDELILDLGSIIDDLEEQNTIANTTELMSLYLGTRMGKWRFGLYHSFRLQTEVSYPRDLAELVWYGNAPYIGEELRIDPSLFYNAWNQIGLHIAYDLGAVQLGVNINRNFGASFGQTESGEVTVFTDPDFYQVSINNTQQMISSSFFTYEEDYTVEIEEDAWREWAFGRNSGWSLDLGINVELNDKLSLHGFLRDLGSISYDENLKRYAGQGEFVYEGVQLQDGLLDQGIDYDVNLDTLITELDYREIDAPSEKEVQLHASYGVGADYMMNEKNRFSLLLSQYRSSFQDRSFDMVHLGWHTRLFKWMWLNANYSYKFERHNVGLGLAIVPGPVQLMLYTDNALVAFPNDEGQQTAVFAGLSFIF